MLYQLPVGSIGVIVGRHGLTFVIAVVMLSPSLLAVSGSSQTPDGATFAGDSTISLFHGSFDPVDGGLPVPAGFEGLWSEASSYRIVQLAGPVRPEWRAALESYGRIVAYIPYYAFLMKLDQDPAALRALDFVRATAPMLPHYKVHPALQTATGDLRLLMDAYPWESDEAVLATASALGARVERVEKSPWHTTIMIRASPSAIPSLAALDEVRWIQPYEDPVLDNGQAQWVIQSGVSDSRPIWNRSLHGEGQLVAYADTGLDYDHSFFRDPNMSAPGKGHRKVVSYEIWEAPAGDQHGHGTHVGGSIAGNDVPTGGSSANIGEAPAAELHVDDAGGGNLGGLPMDLNTLFAVSHNVTNSSAAEGARIHSNSWGWPSEHNYTQAAATTDEFMWNHQEYLVVIAAGNERASGTNSLRSPGLAKNIVTVGATENGAMAGDMASFSSVGPTQGDGRLKPTVCAPGSGIMSALNDNDLNSNNAGETSMSGTSMATPTTAGSLAMLRQYFKEGWYPSGTKTPSDALTPSAALMKSVLIAGAVEITGAGSDYNTEGKYPNNSQGWGRVTLENSLYFNGDANKLWVKDERAGIQTGANVSFKVQVKGTGQPLKIILAWTDAPGAVYSNPSIVNDLDLVVTGPGGTYLGNNFGGLNPGHSVKGGSLDRVNVEEGVILPDPTNGLVAGEYTINVVGHNVPTGPQQFALVVVGDIEGQATVAQVTITPPTANVEVAKNASFQARALDLAGNDVPGAKFKFNVTPATLGTASDLGNGSVGFTAGTKTGTGVLTAESAGKTANATITVVAGPIIAFTISPSTITLPVMGSTPVVAKGQDQYGNDATPASVVWTASPGLDAQVGGSTANETLTAGTKSGSGTLTAAGAGKTATASVTISPGPPKTLEVPARIEVTVGMTVDVSARVLDEHGNAITPATADWATGSGLGTFTPSSGLDVKFKAGTKTGTSTFSATSSGLSAAGELWVVSGPPKTLEVPERIEVEVGMTIDVSARVLDEHGNAITSATASWSAANGLGTFTPSVGLDVKFKAGTTAGKSTFSVTSSGLSATGDLWVVPGPPAKITLTPDRVTLDPRGSAEVTATVFDQYENVLANETIKWESPGFATISASTGNRVLISSEALGGAEGTLYARVGTVQGSASVKVNAFWTPDAFLRGGFSTMLFFLILAAIIGGILGAALVVKRRRSMSCPQCNVRNPRTSTLCSSCGAALHAGPMGPQDGGPPQQGLPPSGPSDPPPPPSDWQPGPSQPGGPGFAPASPSADPYQPPPSWSTQEPMPPSRGRPPQ